MGFSSFLRPSAPSPAPSPAPAPAPAPSGRAGFSAFLRAQAAPEAKSPKQQAPKRQSPTAQAPKAQISKTQTASTREASRRKIAQYLMDNAPARWRAPDPLMPGERKIPGAANAEARRIYDHRYDALYEARESARSYLDESSEEDGLEMDRMLRKFDKYGTRRDPVLAAYLDAHDFAAEYKAYKQKIASGWTERTSRKPSDQPDVQVEDRGPRTKSVPIRFPLSAKGERQDHPSLRQLVKKNGSDPSAWRYRPYEVAVPSSTHFFDREWRHYSTSPFKPDLPKPGDLGFDGERYFFHSHGDFEVHHFEDLNDAIAFAKKVGPGTSVIEYNTDMLRNLVFAEMVWERIKPARVLVHTLPPKRGKYQGPDYQKWTWNGIDWGSSNEQSFDLTYAQYMNFKVPSEDDAFPVGTTHAPGSVRRTNPLDVGVPSREAFYLGISALQQGFDVRNWSWPGIAREDATVYIAPGGSRAHSKKAALLRYGE